MGEIVTRERLVEMVAGARAAGRTVALASGGFDLLHVGHTRYLETAAHEADLLVVAVHDDASVRTIEGHGRPLLAAAHRAQLVAALRAVDLVVVVPDTTVGPLVEVLRPEVYCRRTEETAESTVDSAFERELVSAHGGRTVFVGGSPEHSTRELMRRIVLREPRPDAPPRS